MMAPTSITFVELPLMNRNYYPKHGYPLRLGNSLWWYITADTEELQPWVEKLARIMELDACKVKNATKLIYSINNAEDHKAGHPEIQGAPFYNGWKCRDLNTVCVWYHEDMPVVICKVKPFDSPESEIVTMWHALYPIYRKSISRGGLPFHAGLVDLDGRGVVLAAPGDTGKTTCCSRLPDDWNPLCDDEALLVMDNEGRFRAHPFPTWSDYLWRGSEKTWNVEHSVPIFGVFFIEQSEVDEAIPLGEGKAAVYMNESATQVCRKYWRRADDEYQRTSRRDLFVNASEMANKIPAFRLRVSLHGRFWEEIERALGW